jgi:hypothetical protein
VQTVISMAATEIVRSTPRFKGKYLANFVKKLR